MESATSGARATRYTKYEVQLSNDQIRKIKRGIKENEAVSIRLQPTNSVKTYLMLTQTDINRLSKSSQINLSKTQLKSNRHLLDFKTGSKAATEGVTESATGATRAKKVTFKEKPAVKDVKHDLEKLLEDYKQNLTVRELEELMEMIVGLIRLKSASTQEGENIFKLALPFLKKVLPKVLGTLGLAAASGGISGAVHKAASGGSIYTKSDYEITEDLYKKMHGSSIQSGGFIGTLIASLAGSLLPSLLGGNGVAKGNGLYRAGTKPSKKGSGLYRAGTKPSKKVCRRQWGWTVQSWN